MPTKPQIIPDVILVVGAHDDVIHVAHEAGHHDQRHVDDDETKKAEHRQEMNRSGGLPAAEEPRVPGKAIHDRRRHRDTGQDRERAEDKDHGEIRDLLQRVVAIESVRLGRQVKRGVMDPGVPCLAEHDAAMSERSAATAPCRTA